MTSFLVVDDSPLVRKIARRMLEGFGFSVTEAGDGIEALASCAEARPDAVLLDWNMPNMDGITFLREFRQTPGGVGPKVLFCTTESDFGHISQALEAGADEYIFKPFNQETLESKLQLTGLYP